MPTTILITAIVISAYTPTQSYFQPDNFNSCNDENEMIPTEKSSFIKLKSKLFIKSIIVHHKNLENYVTFFE